MNDLDLISSKLEKIEFSSLSQYFCDLLGAFGIPNSTIQRLLANALEDSFKSPISVYRRATIICDTSFKSRNDIDKLDRDFSSVFRLLILIGNEFIVCKDLVTEEVIELRHSEIHNHVQFFLPLIYGKAVDKDFYTTIDFAELVGTFFTQLCIDSENSYSANQQQYTNFVLSLVYLSFCKSILNDKEIGKIINWAFASQNREYNYIIEGIFNAVFSDKRQGKLFENLPHWPIFKDQNFALPHINSNSFDQIAKIIFFDLSDINTELLGSLIYKLIQEDDSPNIYGHYTSYQNVGKVLNPLFIIKYEKLIEEHKNEVDYLQDLRREILELKFFDPTNGPGCFLTSAFNSVAKLISSIDDLLGIPGTVGMKLSNFIGLVENDLTQKLSHLSLWVTYLQYIGGIQTVRISDLRTAHQQVTIHKGDQLLTDWDLVCKNGGSTLIIGSPTFKGAKKISNLEKTKMQHVFGTKKLGDTDFCSCWLYLAAKYIGTTKSKCSLALTNSICQGVQVAFIWQRIYNLGCDISFAHRSFKWKNNSQQSTGVTVIIIGLSSVLHNAETKHLYMDNLMLKTDCIGPYLINSTKTIVEKRNRSWSTQLPPMPKGNMPYDNQHLLLSREEKNYLIDLYPTAITFLKRIVGSDEFINKIERWCLWIPDQLLNEAISISPIAERIEKVRQVRSANSDSTARRLAQRPHQFREFRSTNTQTLVIPSVSSENRPYIPIGFIGSDTIVTNLAFAIYDCDPWIFGVISSKMHMIWIRTVCGSLETRIRYSSRLGYNTFPFPVISDEKISEINMLVFDLLREREEYCGQTLGGLYNDLPQSIRNLHEILDELIDSCYQTAPFSSDIERIKLLFNLYERQNFAT